ncbi:amidohydrolase family protein [Phycicoccus sp. M110.8]|uniref:N-acetylglucosamine-6-phosphate deacetylase n=1 Tax=Phycicoccus sp. M110.8 TaxID=3075433 RepID=UPI0028FD2CFC|nr:amidohydrolase family protein [Phycicoccus sp. M110.8]MDU0314667.1 amidohydrolase family protein [Phycicoccus sp. M110.8]
MTSTPADTTVLLHGRTVLPDRVVADGAVVVDGGTIAYAGERAGVPAQWAQAPTPPGWEPGATILPGLVDVHCHGGAGGEFGTDAGSATRAVARHHRAGSTSVVGSLVSAPQDVLLAGIATLVPLAEAGELAGIHLEGPFLSVDRCGAQNPDALTDPDSGFVEQVAAAAGPWFAHMTYAPERAGADELPARLAAAGALAAVGHTDAPWEVAARALERVRAAGARGGRPLVTHLFNGMPPLHHRTPGPVAAALAAAARGEAVVEVIADGVHLAAGTVRMVFDTVGAANIALVSDSMSAGGLSDGEYTLGGQAVRVVGREARLVKDGSLAGGVSTLLEQVRWCVQDLGLDLLDAVTAASRTPAAALSLEGVGSLAAGQRADLLVVDDALSLRRVLRRGSWLG